jgi:hypothetical protein
LNTDPARELVEFITTEEGDDLIVSFAITDVEPGNIVSLTLLRMLKYEVFLPPHERGVSVSHESSPSEDVLEVLQRMRLAPPLVTIETTRRRYELDVSEVDDRELQSAQRLLKRMNFDGHFVLELA